MKIPKKSQTEVKKLHNEAELYVYGEDEKNRYFYSFRIGKK